jgi:hypothetical protein
MPYYPSLPQLKLELGTVKATDDALLKSKILAAIRDLEGPKGLGRWIEPRMATRYYQDDAIMGDGRLSVGEDLLAVTTLTNGDAVAIAAASYWLEPRNVTPHWWIHLKSSYAWNWITDGEITLAGVWGWHKRYADAWTNSGDEVEDALGITASATTITIGDDTRFEAMQLIKVDSELMRVTAVNAAIPDTLTVERGVNGSTAATHAKDTDIFIWTPTDDTTENILRMAAYLYRLKDSQVYDTTATPELGIITIPKGIPADVKLWIASNRRYG